MFVNLVDLRSAAPPVGNVTAPQPGTPAYGKYMVDIAGCRGCHGDRLQGKVYSGLGPPTGRNLTQIVPTWTEAQFMTFFNTGQIPGGGQVPTQTLPSGLTEPRMPWPTLRAIATDDELKDVYAYLHNLPPVEGPEK
jgi:hypothetical protein